MSAEILDGKKLAQSLKDSLKKELADLKASTGKTPCMVNIMIGEDHGACAYANSQKRVAEYIGIHYQLKNLPADISPEQLKSEIKTLNRDASVHGILLHKPVPEHINYKISANDINVQKDLEGVNVSNIGKMVLEETRIVPCTPAACMEHLKSLKTDLRGKEVVIVGHSEIVGKPLSLLLLNELATVTVCHIATSQSGRLTDHLSRAEIVIVAVGKANLIKGEWIKDGAVVIDVGINNLDGKIVGDVDFAGVSEKASYITPVPGGVGPVTVVMLMKNCLEAFKQQILGEGKS